MTMPFEPGSIAELESKIRAHGYTLRYVEYCEDARCLLGQIRGVTDHERKEVKIGKIANPTKADMRDILAHELRHLDEPARRRSPDYDRAAAELDKRRVLASAQRE